MANEEADLNSAASNPRSKPQRLKLVIRALRKLSRKGFLFETRLTLCPSLEDSTAARQLCSGDWAQSGSDLKSPRSS